MPEAQALNVLHFAGTSYDHSLNAIALPSKEMPRVWRIFERSHRHTTSGLLGHRTSATAGQRSIQHIAKACHEN